MAILDHNGKEYRRAIGFHGGMVAEKPQVADVVSSTDIEIDPYWRDAEELARKDEE